ncbi:MAG: TniB family NTP-binding protein [Chloroflexota bacterium]|nr:TniB family NTP-binding protein [Chloroflexota bacterium]MDQ5864449.1 TniB family NTP-binding protein [Chloroflexota bacterium]
MDYSVAKKEPNQESGPAPPDRGQQAVPVRQTVVVDYAFDVRLRLQQLQSLHDEWAREDSFLRACARELDMDTQVGQQKAVQIAALRRCLNMKRVREPLELKVQMLKQDGYGALRGHLVEQFAQLTIEERLVWMENFRFIMTPDLRLLNEKIAAVREYNVVGQQRNFLLGGQSGAGKSTYLYWYTLMELPQVGPDTTYVPVVRVDAPRQCRTAKPLFQRMIAACGKTYLKQDSEDNLLMKVVGYIQQCDVALIIVDEIEHITNPEARRALLEVSNLTTGVPIVCSSCNPTRWIEGDNEIAGRWNDHFALQSYRGLRLQQLLALLEMFLPFTKPSFLAGSGKANGKEAEAGSRTANGKGHPVEGHAMLIEQYTGGSLRDIILLLSESSKWAIREGLTNITPRLLQATWKKIQTNSPRGDPTG